MVVTRAEAICITILSIAAAHKITNNKPIASAAIGMLLRQYGKYLVSTHGKKRKYISENAFNSNGAKIKEHAIPVDTLVTKILALYPDISNTISAQTVGLQVLLQDHIHVVIVTKAEDKLLNSQLKSSMPTNWRYDDDWRARYDQVGINVIEEIP